MKNGKPCTTLNCTYDTGCFVQISLIKIYLYNVLNMCTHSTHKKVRISVWFTEKVGVIFVPRWGGEEINNEVYCSLCDI